MNFGQRMLIVLLFFGGFFSESYAISTTLVEKWEAKRSQLEENVGSSSKRDTPNLNEGVVQSLKKRHIFFVPGVMNEWANLGISRYFRTFRRVLNSYDVSSSMFHSSSQNAISTNADLIYTSILSTYEQTEKPLVVIGHSKGSGELLTVLLRHPDLILKGIVDRYVSIQGAIGGSPLAATNSWYVSFLQPVYGNGLHSLQPEIAHETINQAFLNLPLTLQLNADSEDYAQALNNLRQKIFYVRSKEKPKNLSWTISGVRWAARGYPWVSGKDVYESAESQCDGLVAVEDQLFSVNGIPFGNDLGIVDADHTGLTVSTFGNKTYSEQAAFAAALLEALFDRNAL